MDYIKYFLAPKAFLFWQRTAAGSALQLPSTFYEYTFLLAGKYAIEADSVRKRTHSVTATCRDASRGSKVSLLAAFYISEEDYQEEVAARGTLPSNLPIPSELPVPCTQFIKAYLHEFLSHHDALHAGSLPTPHSQPTAQIQRQVSASNLP